MNKTVKHYFFAILFMAICFNSCKKGIIIENLPSIIATKNPTVKKMQFSLNDSASVTIKLKNLVSDKELNLEQLSKKINHEVILAGLKPDQDYLIQILNGKRVLAQIDSFHTAPIEENIVSLYERTNTTNAFDGYLLTQRRLVRGSVYMVDNESDLVWYQMVDGQPKLSHWTQNDEVLVLVGSAKHNNSAGDKIVAYTIDGNISYQIDLKKQGLIAHHESIDHEGGIYSLVYDTIPNMVNGKLEKAVSSAIVRFNKKGEVDWKWSTFDVKNPEGISIEEMDGDWGHANAFAFDTDGNILISYRDWNQIWKVDIKTGKRIWILGEHGDFKFDDTPFNGQHAIRKNLKGDYMLFDNGKKHRQSRIVSYQLNDSTARSITAINLEEHLYADRMGNVQMLLNGDFLLCSPRSRSIAVISPEGDILFHINTGIPDPYRVTHIPPFFSTK
ncbi:aryl-sulfate sulfotransferase [Flavivirga spongiicola]|uniref:Aryl-sulfate sulfotransferase n=1 Tax=Flavivirga spongiicola TaxID=421621 RepID=A0ABU7XQ27_9FLAO|nr:aryl-sulfate sulfotransferase [Flavivirga sp. MEBiC05379]MDO5977873.1 aryl-sulfate sulfotransferase [Flavivirga sp. MEBiC05379]